MAQPSTFLVQYRGAITVPANEPILGSSVPTGNNILIMKTNDAKVSVNGTDMFDVFYGEASMIDAAATYTFNRRVTLAYGVVVPAV